MLSLTVNQVTESTTTRLQELSSSVEFGQERFETFSATVTGQTGAGYPEGTVTVFDASRPLCSAPLGTGTGDAASARCSLSNEELNAGTYSDVYARFTPGGTSSSDSNDTYTGSVSSTKRFTVSPASTATTLTLTSPVTYGSEGAVDFHITVRATGAVPVGSILVLHNSTILCSTTLGPGGTGTCTLSAKQSPSKAVERPLGHRPLHTVKRELLAIIVHSAQAGRARVTTQRSVGRQLLWRGCQAPSSGTPTTKQPRRRPARAVRGGVDRVAELADQAEVRC